MVTGAQPLTTSGIMRSARHHIVTSLSFCCYRKERSIVQHSASTDQRVSCRSHTDHTATVGVAAGSTTPASRRVIDEVVRVIRLNMTHMAVQTMTSSR